VGIKKEVQSRAIN